MLNCVTVGFKHSAFFRLWRCFYAGEYWKSSKKIRTYFLVCLMKSTVSSLYCAHSQWASFCCAKQLWLQQMHILVANKTLKCSFHAFLNCINKHWFQSAFHYFIKTAWNSHRNGAWAATRALSPITIIIDSMNSIFTSLEHVILRILCTRIWLGRFVTFVPLAAIYARRFYSRSFQFQ